MSPTLIIEQRAPIDNAQNLPNFCQSPALDSQDAVAVLEGRDAVGDYNHGQLVMDVFEGLDELALGIEIEGAGSFVEYQQRWLMV